MPTYNIGSCGCCGTATFTLDLLRVAFTNVGFDGDHSYTCDGVVATGLITYPDGTTENVTDTIFFDASASGCGGIGSITRVFNNVTDRTRNTTVTSDHGTSQVFSVWYGYVGKYRDYVAEGDPIMSTTFEAVL